MIVLGHTSNGEKKRQSICDEASLSQIGNAHTTKFITMDGFQS